MKYRTCILVLIGIISLFIPGCVSQSVNDVQYVTDEEKGAEQGQYEKHSISLRLIKEVYPIVRRVKTWEEFKVEKRIGDTPNYEVINIITEPEQVQRIKEILKNIEYTLTTENMDRPADFQFQYRDFDAIEVPKTSIWVNPDKEQLELNTPRGTGILDKKDSAELYKILIGEKLSKHK